MRRLAAFLLLALVLLQPLHPARAQTTSAAAKPPAPTPAPAEQLTPAQAQSVLSILQDDKKRAAFVAVLENMAKAAPAVEPAKPVALEANGIGAQLLVQGAHWAAQLRAQLLAFSSAIGSAPLLWRWLANTAADADARARIGEALLSLAAIVVVARGLEWGTRRLLRGPRRFLEQRAPGDDPVAEDDPDATEAEVHTARRRGLSVAWKMLRRLPFVMAALVLELVPVAVFAAAGNALLATPLGDNNDNRVVVLAVVNAYVICRLVLCLARMFVSPDSHRLRLLQCSDEWALFIERWVRRLAAVAVFGYALGQAGLLFGLYRSGYDVFVKLVALVIHGMLIVVVLRSRHALAHRLRARRSRTGTLAAFQNQLASHWHLIAIFYIVALWVVAALEIRDGYQRLLHFFIVTSAVIAAARLIGIILIGTLDRSVRLDAERLAQQPVLEQRLMHYYPIMRSALVTALVVCTGFALLWTWGFNPLTSLAATQLGAQLLAALATSAVTVLLAVVGWEFANTAIEQKVTSLTESAQTARAARLRTLLPMLRTALFVALLITAGLIVLSQIGVNIAPLLAGAGVLGVAIGFGSQKLVQDLITGLFLLLENTMQVGDVVNLAGLSGTVEYLSIRTIRLRALDGSVHIIPFSSVTTVTNQTRDYSYALVDLPIGLDEEPDRVAQLVSAVAKDMRAEPRWQDSITADLEVMGVYAFADNVWTLRVRLRTTPSQRWSVNREFNRRVKYAFDRNAVQSPLTSYKAQGWLPPGSAFPIPKTPPPGDDQALRQAAQ